VNTVISVLSVHVPGHMTYPLRKNRSQRDKNKCFTEVFRL